jgi:hypothetical protein
LDQLNENFLRKDKSPLRRGPTRASLLLNNGGGEAPATNVSKHPIAGRKPMDLKQVNYFMWVYEEGSFSKAAAKANVVQSALSMQIRRIEDEFGILLFNRLSRGVEPTEAGRKFYERCVPIAGNCALAQ